MKIYVKASDDMMQQGQSFTSQLQQKLEELSVPFEAIQFFNVTPVSTRSYLASIVLTSKKYHGKKFSSKFNLKNAQNSLDQLAFDVASYLGGDVSSGYLRLLYLDDIPLGYFKGDSYKRSRMAGDYETGLSLSPEYGIVFPDADKQLYIPAYFFVSTGLLGHSLNFAVLGINMYDSGYDESDLDDNYFNVDKSRIHYESIPVSEATVIPNPQAQVIQVLREG